jgi:hypothetical protein
VYVKTCPHLSHPKHHLSIPGLCDIFQRIAIVSDHGSHFACSQVFLKTCSYYRIYKKEVSFLFLPAYHGEGRADGAGSEDKLNLQAALREGVLVLGAEGMATMSKKQRRSLVSLSYGGNRPE